MKYVAALDVGTTTVRFHLVDEHANTVAANSEKVELLYPNPGYVEIDPDQLWNSIVKVVRDTITDSNVKPESIVSLGISTQRGTFTTWNRETGRHYHNFITWKDLRADSMVKEWNSSMTIKGLRAGAHILYSVSRSKRFKAGSVLKLMNTQMTLRLSWALQNVSGLKEAVASGKAVFGGVDSWLLFQLTGQHICDVSSASATGLFDPFTMEWAGWAQQLFKIPRSIFPKIVNTTGDFGKICAQVFGVEIPIRCSMADQAASLYGSGCFQPGSLKLTMGTGSFLNVNTGNEPHASVAGLYPLVGWQIGSELIYSAEGASNDTGSIIEWAVRLGLSEDASKTSELAYSVSDSDGVYFVPAFSGLQELKLIAFVSRLPNEAPPNANQVWRKFSKKINYQFQPSINDQRAASGFIGCRPTTTKAHLVRAMLESLVFRILLLYNALREETDYSYHLIRVDGGVSQNDFMMQLIADLSGLKVERPASSEMSIMGVAFLAGMEAGVWNSNKELLHLRRVDKIFEPDEKRRLQYEPIVSGWRKAVQRFKNWC